MFFLEDIMSGKYEDALKNFDAELLSNINTDTRTLHNSFDVFHNLEIFSMEIEKLKENYNIRVLL